jgi:prevent-host-death family protein
MAGGYVWREPASAGRSERLQTPCSSWIIQLRGRSGVPVLKVPAGEFQRNIGRYQDMALTQPVAVTRNGRERTVLISADEYQRLKRRDRQVLTLSDFTEADITALEATRAPESSKAFDPELQQ